MAAKAYPFWQVSSHIFILGAGASLAAFRDGDKYGLKLPLMNNFVETLKLEHFLEKYNIQYKDRNFEEIYDEIYRLPNNEAILNEINNIVYEYFSKFKITNHITLYDELILSLRKKDAIFSFNWDPLLVQAYQRNVHLKELPKIHFLHGNVAIGVCIEHRRVGYLGNKCSICNRFLAQTKLLYPIKDKNYKFDPFIESEWKALEYYLDNSFILTLFGYSAPKTDALAKKMMLKAWDLNQRKELNEIEIIDIKGDDELHENWKDFIVRHHYASHKSIRNSFSFCYSRRSCDAWGSAIMMNDPWKEKKLPTFKTLSELQDWVSPLIEKEINFEKYDKPLSKFE